MACIYFLTREIKKNKEWNTKVPIGGGNPCILETLYWVISISFFVVVVLFCFLNLWLMPWYSLQRSLSLGPNLSPGNNKIMENFRSSILKIILNSKPLSSHYLFTKWTKDVTSSVSGRAGQRALVIAFGGPGGSGHLHSSLSPCCSLHCGSLGIPSHLAFLVESGLSGVRAAWQFPPARLLSLLT